MKTSLVRKSLCFLLLSALIVTMTMPFHASAAATDEVIDYSVEDLGDGITVESVVTLSSTRTLRSATNINTFKRDGKEFAKVTLYATFTYNGSLASVWSKDYSKSTSFGWVYNSHQITTMDRTPSASVTLDAKLTTIGGYVPVHMTLRCSPTGTITK